MKKKIISFVGLLLFVGVVAFNMQMVSSNVQTSKVTLENIEALASTAICYWSYDQGWWCGGSIIRCDHCTRIENICSKDDEDTCQQ